MARAALKTATSNTVTAQAIPGPGRADTRRRLLDAAGEELLAGRGHFEMADVARRAGVSVGLSYHYFGSKAGLLAAIVEDFYDRYDAAVIAPNPLPGGDWGRRERRRLEAMVQFHLSEPLAPFILGSLSREPAVAAVEAARLQKHIQLGAHNIALGQKRGELPPHPDPELLAAMVMGGLRQGIGQALAKRQGQLPLLPAPDLSGRLWDFVVAAVRYSGAKNG